MRGGGRRAGSLYSGGIGTLEDLRALAALGPANLEGVIVGKALYEGRFDVAEARAALAGGRGMSVLKRVIPCLDVDKGRVVKGTNFVGLRDAGDPVELAERYDAEGADELVFLDITASHEARDTIVSWRGAPPTTSSSRSRSAAASARARTRRRCSTPAPTRCRSTPPRSRGRS